MTQRLYIGCVRARGPVSRTIEWFGGGPAYSHITTLWPYDQSRVIDARSDDVEGCPPGVQLRPLAYLDHSHVDWIGIDCSAATLRRTADALMSQENKPYYKQGIIDIALGRRASQDWRDDSAWFCSEFAVWSWERGGVIGKMPWQYTTFTPSDAALIAWGAANPAAR